MSRLAICDFNVLRVYNDGTLLNLYNLGQGVSQLDMKNFNGFLFFGTGYLDSQSMNIVDYHNSGYHYTNEPLQVNLCDVLGSGVRGVISNKDLPDTDRITLGRSVYIYDEIMFKFFFNVTRIFYDYINSGVNPYGTLNLLNLLITMISPPLYDEKGDQQIINPIEIEYLLNFREMYNNLRLSNTILPAPISIFLSNFGYDSIISGIVSQFSVVLPHRFSTLS